MNLAKVGVEHRFSATNQPKNRGRKPSKLKKYIKENNLDKIDVEFLFKHLLSKTREELTELADNKNIPFIVSGLAGHLLKDIFYGKLHTFIFMIEYAFGKPAQPLSHSGDVNMNYTNLSDKERTKRIDELLMKRKLNNVAESEK